MARQVDRETIARDRRMGAEPEKMLSSLATIEQRQEVVGVYLGAYAEESNRRIAEGRTDGDAR